MPIRRAANPISVQHVWDAVRSTALQRQMPDTKRIAKFLQKADKCTNSQAELYIQQTVHDGLIVALHKSIKGEQVESFKIPTQELPELDGKDWYCFECHLGGNVNSCKECFRVFHVDCISAGRQKFDEFKNTNIQKRLSDTFSTLNVSNISSCSDNATPNEPSTYKTNNNEVNRSQTDGSYDQELCSICNISKVDLDCSLEKTELNYMLKFVIHRIQSWLPNTITHTMAEEDRPEWLTDKELTWRANQLFFEHRDMSVIEVNLNNESYGHLYEFLADVLTIQHNVAIFHGIESQEYGASELMVRDCMHDLAELKICVDCYRHSNEKINSKWFCLPCRVPHELVWAKQKGYPHWPAKVIRVTNTHYDVRFFGGKYERSLLAKCFIKPIQTPKEKLTIKTSTAFNKSVEELKFHQKLLANPAELRQLIESSKLLKSRSIVNKRITPLKALQRPSSSSSVSTPNQRKNSCDANNPSQLSDNEQNSNTSHGKLKRKLNHEETASRKKNSSGSQNVSSDSKHESVIDISDGEDETEFSFRENNYNTFNNVDYNNTYDQVTSSTENFKLNDFSTHTTTQDNGMQQLDHPFSDSVEKMRRRLESLTDKREIIKCAMDSMQSEVDKITNDHNDHLKRLFESHNAQISETKKKQWCYNCEQDAIYHCCWNTAYCSQSCQQQHWQAEHKKVCRRKR